MFGDTMLREHTVADEIFDEEAYERYKTGDLHFIKLYEQVNELFPMKIGAQLCTLLRSDNIFIKEN